MLCTYYRMEPKLQQARRYIDLAYDQQQDGLQTDTEYP